MKRLNKSVTGAEIDAWLRAKRLSLQWVRQFNAELAQINAMVATKQQPTTSKRRKQEVLNAASDLDEQIHRSFKAQERRGRIVDEDTTEAMKTHR